MCVAIYKPKGVDSPSMDTLEKCWNRNPDGAGYAWRREDGLIEWRKGFMKFNDFWESFDALADKTGKTMFIHFRIGTHGGNTPQNTHPFPISSDVDDLKKTGGVCDSILMHNGVLPITPRMKDISDTMELVLRIAEAGLGAKGAMGLLSGFTTDRIAMMDRSNLCMIGEWSQADGVYYSNLLWQNTMFGAWGRMDEDTLVDEWMPDGKELGKLRKKLGKAGLDMTPWGLKNEARDFIESAGYYEEDEFIDYIMDLYGVWMDDAVAEE